MTLRSVARRVFELVPLPVLARAGRFLARTRPLAPEPGWYFDKSEEDRGALTGARRAIWGRFAAVAAQHPITIAWYDDLRLKLYLGNDLSKCLYVGGSFEPNEFALLDQVLDEAMVVVDGGANDGIYSLFASIRVGPTGRVLAFEPSPREQQRLRVNLGLNDVHNVDVYDAALGASMGRTLLAIAGYGHEGQNTVGEAVSNPNVDTVDRISVPVLTLDDVVREARLERVDLIKLDIEGSEVAALRGADATLRRFTPLLQLEMEESALEKQGSSRRELLQLLASHGYTTWVFDAATGRPRSSEVIAELHGNVICAPAGWEPPAATRRLRGRPEQPYLSVVATARNDNHGGDLLHRLEVFANGLAAQVRRHRITTELVLVEWNPPADRPRLVEAIDWPAQDESFRIRIIEVPHELHARLEHSDRLPLFQMIAKNVGVRRARGRFVLATNVDVLFSNELVEPIARRALVPGRVYRADRHDVLGPLDPHAPVDEQLAAARETVIRISMLEGTHDIRTGEYFSIYGPMTRWPGPLARWGRLVRFGTPIGVRLAGRVVRRGPVIIYRTWSDVIRHSEPARALLLLRTPAGHDRIRSAWRSLAAREQPEADGLRQLGSAREWLDVRVRDLLAQFSVQRRSIRNTWEREKARVRLHTNACGDFTLMAREDWHRVQGYMELELFSMHLDSLLLYEAHYARLRHTILPGVVYHLEHGGGFRPDAAGVRALNEQLDQKAIPQVSNEQFLDLIMQMYRQQSPLRLNGADWGLARCSLREFVPLRAPS